MLVVLSAFMRKNRLDKAVNIEAEKEITNAFTATTSVKYDITEIDKSKLLFTLKEYIH